MGSKHFRLKLKSNPNTGTLRKAQELGIFIRGGVKQRTLFWREREREIVSRHTLFRACREAFLNQDATKKMQLQDLDIFEGQIPERESNQGKKRVSKTLAYFIAGVIHESVPGFG